LVVAETAATTGKSIATVFHIWTEANQVCCSVICVWIGTLVLWFHVVPCVNNEGPDTSCTEFTYSSSYDFMPNLAAFRRTRVCCLTHRWSFHTVKQQVQLLKSVLQSSNSPSLGVTAHCEIWPNQQFSSTLLYL
jgi:hypothetical protein